MRNRVVSFLALATGLWVDGVPAFAADVLVPVPASGQLVSVEAPSWSGLYAGFSVGYGLAGDDEVDAQAFPGDQPIILGTLSPKGGLAGLQAGYNWQHGNLVFGVETDLQFSDIHAQGTAEAFGQALGSSSTALDWYGTLRGRVGYASGRNLFYATGGLAYGGLDGMTETAGAGGYSATLATGDETAAGYALGAGIEHALTDRISLRGDYQYIHFGATASGPVLDPLGADTGVVASSDVDLGVHTFRVGLNVHF